jgi:hypothetical protein
VPGRGVRRLSGCYRAACVVCQRGRHAAGAALVLGVRTEGAVADLGGLRPDRRDAKPRRRADQVPGPAGRGSAGGYLEAGRARGQRPVRGAWPGDPDRAASSGAAAGLGAAGGAAGPRRRPGGPGPRALRGGSGRAAAGQARGAPPRQPASGHRAPERAAWAAPSHAARGGAACGRGHRGAVAAAGGGRGDRADPVNRAAAARRRDTGRPGACDPARLRPGPVRRGGGRPVSGPAPAAGRLPGAAGAAEGCRHPAGGVRIPPLGDPAAAGRRRARPRGAAAPRAAVRQPGTLRRLRAACRGPGGTTACGRARAAQLV